MLNRLSKALGETPIPPTTNGNNPNANTNDDDGDDIDDDNDATKSTGNSNNNNNSVTSSKAWEAYVNRFLPTERSDCFTPTEIDLERQYGLSTNEAWKALPLHVRLNIIRAYEVEQDRAGVTKTASADIIAWRAKYKVQTMLLTGPLPGSDAYFNNWPTRITTVSSPGDRYGHPILFDQISEMDFDRLMSMDEDSFFRYRTQALESLYFAKEQFSLQKKFRVSKHIYILDLKGLSSKHMNKKLQDKLKPVFTMSSAIFPEILWSMWIINAPMTFRSIWSVVRNFVDPAVRAKIRMFGPTQSKWHKAMEQVGIPIQSLPIEFGGQAQSESLRDVLVRARYYNLPESEFIQEVQSYFQIHQPSQVNLVTELLKATSDNRIELITTIQSQYIFPVFSHLIHATFGPGPLGMIIKGKSLPQSLSVVGKHIVQVVGWAPPGSDKSLGQAEKLGTIAIGDIIVAIGDISVMGMTEPEVKQKLVEAVRPVVVTFSRFGLPV
jgi:hypothetical protein